MTHRIKPTAIVLAAGIAAMASGAQAASFSSLVVFGDSLSDTGNVLALTTAFTPNPFPTFPGAAGRFSNGVVWTDVLANGLGLPAGAQPANLIFDGTTVQTIGVPGGQNFAFGGARTGLGGSAGPTTGIFGQLINWNGGAFAAATGLTRAADPNALYVLVAGGNDMRDARTNFSGSTAADAAGRQAAAGAAVQNMVNALGLLAQAGARNFLVGNLPDLGRTPEAIDDGASVVAASSDASAQFNIALGMGLAGFETGFLGLTGIDLNIVALDLAGIATAVFEDATNNGGAVYGITNPSVPCIEPALGQYYIPLATDANGNCPVSSFSDDLHPTAALHTLVGRAALAAVSGPTAVPEPSVLWLAMASLAGVAVASRRRRA